MSNPQMIGSEHSCNLVPYFYANDMVVAYAVVSDNLTTVGYLWFYGSSDEYKPDYEQIQKAWGLSTVCGYSLSLDYINKINTIFAEID